MSEQIKEEWKPIEGFEGFYEISNFGRVKSLRMRGGRKDRILKNVVNPDGYEHLTLSCNKKTRDATIHRLVAESFIPNPDNLPQINHKDQCKTNNHVENLEWCTAKHNVNYLDFQERRAKSYSKKVYQYDKNLNLIKIWESSTEASKYGFNRTAISFCCCGKRPYHKNYVWSHLPLSY